MIIKSVELENYRSHKHMYLDFSRGINLILGQNGSGKSSVLEAIAIVLFNINDRTGKEIGKKYIKYGENSANVKIDFIGNDGREYSVDNKFYLKKGKTLILSDLTTGEKYKENVREKLNELCGIKNEYAKIYDNIVIAKQNEFVNIFKEKDSTRAEVFNKIFNTDIYLNMSSKVFKQIEDKYSDERKEIEIQKNTLNSKLEDTDIIFRELENDLKEKEKLEKDFENLKSQKADKEKILNFYKEKENKIKEIENKIKIEETKYETEKNSLKDNLYATEKRKSSKIITEENEKYYIEHQEILNEVKILRLEKNKEELIEKNNSILVQENKKLLWEIDNNEKKLNEIEENLKEKKLKNEEKKVSFQEKSIRKEKLLEEGKKLNEIKEKIRKEKERKNELDKEKYSKENELENLKNIITKNKKILETISLVEIEKKLKDIEEYNDKIEKLEKEITIFEEKNKLLEESKEKLKEAFCPLLDEKCQNIKVNSVSDFFNTKININKNEMENLKFDLVLLNEKVKEEAILKKQKIENMVLIRDCEKIEIKIKEEELIIQKIELELEKNNINILKMLDENKFRDEKDLENYFEKIKGEYHSLGIEVLEKEIRELSSQIEELVFKKEEIIKLIEKNKLSILDNKEKIVFGTEEKLNIFKEKIEKLENREKEIVEFSKKYIENINLANELEEFLKRIDSNKENIGILEKKLNKLKEDKEEISLEISEISIDILKEEVEKIDEQIFSINQNIGQIQEQIKSKNEKLEIINREKTKIALMQKTIQKLENKIIKTKKIRDNLKNMGLKISKYMLDNISIKATSNFNKITGRSEIIEWSNEDKDKYVVYLTGKNGQIPFENLSGGEQVSVAISIRGTMTEIFSNSRFMILDEPTNNLDKERKKLLAEYMGEMLNNLDQSIIVTHDDTFREMAERIIEL